MGNGVNGGATTLKWIRSSFGDDWVAVVDHVQDTLLQFTQLEWSAFIAGLGAGDFELAP